MNTEGRAALLALPRLLIFLGISRRHREAVLSRIVPGRGDIPHSAGTDAQYLARRQPNQQIQRFQSYLLAPCCRCF